MDDPLSILQTEVCLQCPIFFQMRNWYCIKVSSSKKKHYGKTCFAYTVLEVISHFCKWHLRSFFNHPLNFCNCITLLPFQSKSIRRSSEYTPSYFGYWIRIVSWNYTTIFHRKCYRSQGLVTFIAVLVVTANKSSDLKRTVVLCELKSDWSLF